MCHGPTARPSGKTINDINKLYLKSDWGGHTFIFDFIGGVILLFAKFVEGVIH